MDGMIFVEAYEMNQPTAKYAFMLRGSATVADLKREISTRASIPARSSPEVWFSPNESLAECLANWPKGIRKNIDIPYADNKRISEIPKPQGVNYYIVRYAGKATTRAGGGGEKKRKGGNLRRKSRKRKSKRRKRKKSKRSKRSKRR